MTKKIINSLIYDHYRFRVDLCIIETVTGKSIVGIDMSNSTPAKPLTSIEIVEVIILITFWSIVLITFLAMGVIFLKDKIATIPPEKYYNQVPGEIHSFNWSGKGDFIAAEMYIKPHNFLVLLANNGNTIHILGVNENKDFPKVVWSKDNEFVKFEYADNEYIYNVNGRMLNNDDRILWDFIIPESFSYDKKYKVTESTSTIDNENQPKDLYIINEEKRQRVKTLTDTRIEKVFWAPNAYIIAYNKEINGHWKLIIEAINDL